MAVFYNSGDDKLSFFELLMIALGLSMDAFAVSICKGLSLKKINIKHMIIAGLWFGGFQALMPTLGYYLGSLFSEAVDKFDHWIAFILLAIIGVSMIKESFDEVDTHDSDMGVKTMLMLAIATSIDAFAVGVSFAFLGANIGIADLVIGLTTFICSAVGIKIGSIFGLKYKANAERIGGVILIIIGIKILLDGLGIVLF